MTQHQDQAGSAGAGSEAPAGLGQNTRGDANFSGFTKERSDAEFLTGMAALIQSDRFKAFSVMLLRRGQ